MEGGGGSTQSYWGLQEQESPRSQPFPSSLTYRPNVFGFKKWAYHSLHCCGRCDRCCCCCGGHFQDGGKAGLCAAGSVGGHSSSTCCMRLRTSCTFFFSCSNFRASRRQHLVKTPMVSIVAESVAVLRCGLTLVPAVGATAVAAAVSSPELKDGGLSRCMAQSGDSVRQMRCTASLDTVRARMAYVLFRVDRYRFSTA